MIACIDKHDLPPGVLWRRVTEYCGGDWLRQADGTYTQSVFAYYLSIACNHCENPICVRSCPTTAKHKDAPGIVSVDHEKCGGCRFGDWACPYSAPQYDADLGKMTNVRLLPRQPRGGQAAGMRGRLPNRALEFGEYEDLAARYGASQVIAPLPDATITQPNLVITPGRNAKPAGSHAGNDTQPRGGLAMPTNEWSLVLFTILMQTSVGLLLASEAARLVTGVPRGALSWQTPTAGASPRPACCFPLPIWERPPIACSPSSTCVSSWLSREILSTGAFFLALVALIALRARTPGQNAWGMSAVAVLLGLAAVAVMSRVYLLVSVPVWDTVATVLSFFGTALLLGAVVGGLLYAIQGGRLAPSDGASGLSGIFSAVAIAGLALQFLGIPLGLAAIGTAATPALAGPFALSSGGLGLLVLRILLIFFGAVLFAWSMFRPPSFGNPRALVRVSACALICVLAGEVRGRLLFYGSYLRVGL
jgi:anaerobic dimethyl sulfoxide reductase subunit B (iron-sulfur subunit)